MRVMRITKPFHLLRTPYNSVLLLYDVFTIKVLVEEVKYHVLGTQLSGILIKQEF